jgi:hypothetical protein
VTAPQTPQSPGTLADALVPDLVAIIGHLAVGSGPRQPAAPASVPAGQPPGVVSVRLSGDPAAIDTTAAALAAVFEVLNRTGPRPNRRDPGQRVYLTIRTAPARPAGAGPSA